MWILTCKFVFSIMTLKGKPHIKQEREIFTMRISLDLDTNEIIVPKNFFKEIEKQNDMIVKMGGEPIKPVDLIKKSFEVAMSNTDKNLHVRA